MMGSPMQPQPSAAQQKCIEDFTAWRTKTEKAGAVARAAGSRKTSREEMCKQITAYAAVEGRWAKFTADNVTKCGIPPQIAQQLREAHNRTLATRKNVCAAGSAPTASAAPSLSDALGTTRMPVPGGSGSRSGTLDTLTGNAITR